jgi:hypothetical protein
LQNAAAPRIGTGGAGGGGSGAGEPGFNSQQGTDGLGGGGGGGSGGPRAAARGGNGVVILRAPAAAKFTVSPGSNTVQTTPTGEKYATFTVSGTLLI